MMTCNVTIRARIAGRVTPSTNNMNCLEVIEIPTFGKSYRFYFDHFFFPQLLYFIHSFSSIHQFAVAVKVKAISFKNWLFANALELLYVRKTIF